MEKHIKSFNEATENLNDVNYSIGDKYELFYNPNNPNNKKFEIRGIIDDEMVIFLTSKGNYKMEDILWFEFNIETGKLIKII